jgi:hypothetical protein
MQKLIWLLVAVLIIVHQDFWYWEDSTLVFGFMPIGLFYHACISLAAGMVWLLACVFAWPQELAEVDAADAKVAGKGGQV